jgi:YggT family protein
MVVSKFLLALSSLLSEVIFIYTWVVIIAALITWVRPDPYSPVVQILYRLTQPAYDLMRRYIPTMIGGIDLSPIILILILKFFDNFVVELIRAYALGLV